MTGDILAVGRPRAVDLAERGVGERLLADVGEQLPDAGVEVLLDDGLHAAEGDRAPSRSAPSTRRGRSPSETRSSWTIERNCLIFGPALFSRPS